MDSVTNGLFTSVWSGEGEAETDCKVNLTTHEVFDIHTTDPDDSGLECAVLEYEYVEYGYGNVLHRIPVYRLEDYENEDEAIEESKKDGSFWRR